MVDARIGRLYHLVSEHAFSGRLPNRPHGLERQHYMRPARGAALHGLLGLQLPLFGGYLGGWQLTGRHVQLDPEPGG
eukprot:scaffold2516_cov48-Phaeocystis_antarctica.AAC.2